MGRPPRRADAMRGKIGRLIAANEERHEEAQKQRDQTKISIELVQRIFHLVQRLGKVAHIHNPLQLKFVRQGMPAELSVNAVHELIGRHQNRICARCGYSLRGLPHSGACPECGDRYYAFAGDWDFTAADLYQYATAHEQTHCSQCKYSLRGLPRQGTCPECGARFRTGAISWQELCQFLSDELKVPLEKVHANMRIVERLTECSRQQIEDERT